MKLTVNASVDYYAQKQNQELLIYLFILLMNHAVTIRWWCGLQMAENTVDQPVPVMSNQK